MMSDPSHTSPQPQTVRMRGVDFHCVTEAQCNQHIRDSLEAGQGGWVITANLDHLRRAVGDPAYVELCEQATLVVADGMPLIWASRLQGTPLPERVAGSSMISTLSEAVAQDHRSIYLLGGDPGTAEAAGEVLVQRYPSLKITGSYCPEFGFEKDQEAVDRIVGLLVEAKPDLVYVALGSPKQELLIGQLRQNLPYAWWIGVGISFSFLCGQVRRAPRWMQVTGLEWVHRMVQEPHRLAKRYLVYGIPFALSLLGIAVWNRLRRKNGCGRLHGEEAC